MILLKSKLYFIILLLMVMAIACNNKDSDNNATINLKVELTSVFKGYIYLYRITPNSTIAIDSTLVNGTNVELETKAYQSPDIYLLRLSPKQSIMLSAKSGENIDINIDPKTIPVKYSISNSADSKLIKENNSIINSAASEFDSIYAIYRTSKEDISILRKTTDSNLKAIQENLYYNLKSRIEEQPAELSSVIALYGRFANSMIFNIELDSSLFYLVSDSCTAKYPNNSHCIELKNTTNEIKNKFINIEIKEHLLDKGNIFKDICLIKLDESNYCIHNNIAEYKIIYLWRSKDKAFWDINPILKEIYDSTEREKLDIIGISAEKDKLSWRNYCNIERLNWINLIAEPNQLKEINPRETFPRIYILDKDFRIIAKDPAVNDIKNLIQE